MANVSKLIPFVLGHLLLGMALTICVAWVVPRFSNYTVEDRSENHGKSQSDRYHYLRLEEFGYRLGPYQMLAQVIQIRHDQQNESYCRIDRAGIPFLALEATWYTQPFHSEKNAVRWSMTQKARLRSGIRLRDDLALEFPPGNIVAGRCLPIRLRVFPLLGNTCVFGCALAALFQIPVLRARSYWRRCSSNHICTRCGYDLRARPESRCPECGFAAESSPPPFLSGTLLKVTWTVAILSVVITLMIGMFCWWQSEVL